MKKITVILVTLIFVSLLITSCQASETNKWTPPKFVKEWEVKEIKPGRTPYIISMTANKNGVFVLVKAKETKYTPPKKLSEMAEKEKEEEIKKMKFLFGRILNDEERMRDTATFGKTEEINHYRLQHYNFEGNFQRQWPENNLLRVSEKIKSKIGTFNIIVSGREGTVDSTNELIKPLYVASDYEGKLYLADYEGNKIVQFDSDGNVSNLWKIEHKRELKGYYRDLSSQRGFTIFKNRLYLISQGFDKKIGSVPRISEYDLNGKLVREKTIKPPKVPAQMPITGKKVPFLRAEANVTDIAVDRNGNLYLFAADTRILILDNQWNEKGYIKTVLKKGFERPKPVYDPDRKREIRYDEEISKITGVSFRGFSSDKVSWIESVPGLYYANRIHFSPEEELYVSFIGTKPFGIIDAMIFNKKGKMIGYWKHDKKSYSEWLDKLTDLQQLETTDVELDIAFYGNNIFIGRMLEEGIRTGRYHTVIQKFVKEGKAK